MLYACSVIKKRGMWSNVFAYFVAQNNIGLDSLISMKVSYVNIY